MEDTARRAGAVAPLAEHGAALLGIFDHIDGMLAALAQADPVGAFDNATWFLRAFGHAVVAWLWLDIAILATAGLDDDFRRGKIKACRFFFESELPQGAGLVADCQRGEPGARGNGTFGILTTGFGTTGCNWSGS